MEGGPAGEWPEVPPAPPEVGAGSGTASGSGAGAWAAALLARALVSEKVRKMIAQFGAELLLACVILVIYLLYYFKRVSKVSIALVGECASRTFIEGAHKLTKNQNSFARSLARPNRN